MLTAYGDFFAHKLDKFLLDDAVPPLERMAAFVRHASQGMEKFQFRRGCGGQPAAGSPVVTRDVSPTVDGYPAAWESRVALRAKRRQPGHRQRRLTAGAGPVFWIGWEGAVMRALVQSAAPLNQYWDFCAQYDNKNTCTGRRCADNPFRREYSVMKALVLDQIDNRTVATVKDIDLPALAEGDVRVAIDWSSLNYKDAAITGKGKIIRQFPMVPGIDFAGQVKESRDPRFVPGAVILTGWGVGAGVAATEACVKGDWLVALPETLSARRNDHWHRRLPRCYALMLSLVRVSP